MICIKQGRESITGRCASGWTVHIPGQRAIGCRKLAEAKAAAIEAGASGKWRREVKPVGTRGSDIIHYYDAAEVGATC